MLFPAPTDGVKTDEIIARKHTVAGGVLTQTARARGTGCIFYLQASHSNAHRSNHQEVISQKPLQLGDTAALQAPTGPSQQGSQT